MLYHVLLAAGPQEVLNVAMLKVRWITHRDSTVTSGRVTLPTPNPGLHSTGACSEAVIGIGDAANEPIPI